MKFGQNLPRNQVPEWASSYIDYKGLKKLIKAAQKESVDGKDADLAGMLSMALGCIDAPLTRTLQSSSTPLTGTLKMSTRSTTASLPSFLGGSSCCTTDMGMRRNRRREWTRMRWKT